MVAHGLPWLLAVLRKGLREDKCGIMKAGSGVLDVVSDRKGSGWRIGVSKAEVASDEKESRDRIDSGISGSVTSQLQSVIL